jgi:hypothetical protein
MTAKTWLLVFLILLAIISSRLNPLAQATSQNRGSRIGSVTTPCLVSQTSLDCATYVENRLDALQESIRALQSRPTGTLLSGQTIPNVDSIRKPGKADNANDTYILQRLDKLTITVNQLVDRLNSAK